MLCTNLTKFILFVFISKISFFRTVCDSYGQCCKSYLRSELQQVKQHRWQSQYGKNMKVILSTSLNDLLKHVLLYTLRCSWFNKYFFSPILIKMIYWVIVNNLTCISQWKPLSFINSYQSMMLQSFIYLFILLYRIWWIKEEKQLTSGSLNDRKRGGSRRNYL